eukprot:4081887-Pyramimonas_sp.AAC.1
MIRIIQSVDTLGSRSHAFKRSANRCAASEGSWSTSLGWKPPHPKAEPLAKRLHAEHKSSGEIGSRKLETSQDD